MADAQIQAQPVTQPTPQPTPQPVDQQINVINPDGKLVAIPQTQFEEAQGLGYQMAPQETVEAAKKEAKYGTPIEQAKTFGEGAASALTFGASTAAELATGKVRKEDIEGRREVNPATHFGGALTGIGGSLFLGPAGAANIVAHAGEAGAEAIGLGAAEAGLASKIGASAVKGAVENAMIQSGDEVSKMLTSDNPSDAAQSAAVNIGLAGLIGGGIGGGMSAVSPLWKLTNGSKVGKLLGALKDKMGGIEGQAPDVLDDTIAKSGLDLKPEVKASLSKDPTFRQMAETLRQSDTTKSGLEYQQSLKQFQKDASDALASSVGRSPEEVLPKSEISEYESGKNISKILADELESKSGPIAKKFEELKSKYSDVELPQTVNGQVAENIGQLVQREGWYVSPSSEIMGEVNRALKEVPNLKTLKDLTHYITQVGSNTADFTNPSLMRAGALMKGVLKDAESEVVTSKLGAEAPHLIGEHAAARTAWKDVSALKDALDARLKLPGGDSIGSFLKNLREVGQEGGEKIIRKLSAKDADLINTLKESFPQTAETLRQYHLNDLLGKAADRATEGEAINAKAFFKGIDKMSPELRDFVLSPESQEKISAIKSISEGLESKTHNFSNTARTIDKLWDSIPGSALGLATALTTHNPLLGFLMAPLTKWLGRDVPDATRLGLLKFLGSDSKLDSEGFKAMVDFIEHVQKGESIMNKSAKNLFKSGVEVLPQALIPSDKDKQNLSKKIDSLNEDNKDLLNIGGKTAHYLPQHGEALGQLGASAVNYISSQKPQNPQQAPLDTKIKPTDIQKAVYDRTLEIAQQPLVVLNSIKTGNLTPHDVQALTNIYPALYQRLKSKVYNNLIEAHSKDVNIPYKTRLNLAMFLGEPLDSTMSPQAIIANQVKAAGMANMPQPQRAKHSMTSLNKMSSLYSTAAQSREANRLK
jgi:hypothetical protein